MSIASKCGLCGTATYDGVWHQCKPVEDDAHPCCSCDVVSAMKHEIVCAQLNMTENACAEKESEILRLRAELKHAKARIAELLGEV